MFSSWPSSRRKPLFARGGGDGKSFEKVSLDDDTRLHWHPAPPRALLAHEVKEASGQLPPPEGAGQIERRTSERSC